MDGLKPITRAIAKLKAGEDLTDEELAAYRAVIKDGRARSAQVYFASPQQLAEYRAMADAAGYAKFSSWVCDMVARGASGEVVPPGEMEALREATDDFKAKWERERELAEEYRLRARDLEAKMEEWADKLFVMASEREA